MIGSVERTEEDLDRAVRSISRHFKSDTVIIIGSQSILLDHPSAPALLRSSGEIDAYPGNADEWEESHRGFLASEEINALFGIGSNFHGTFGFYIDGVDKNTAKFPPGWEERSVKKIVQDGDKKIQVIAPSLEDLIVSKLHRLDPKDKEFIQACQQVQRLDVALIKLLLADSKPESEIFTNASGFLDTL